MRIAVVGLTALLMLAAATDQRNSITDRSSGAAQRIGHQTPPQTIEAMVQEMLTHD